MPNQYYLTNTETDKEYYINKYLDGSKKNKIIKDIVHFYREAEGETLEPDDQIYTERYDKLLRWLNYLTDSSLVIYSSDDRPFIHLIIFISFIHLSNGYYDAFVACMLEKNFRNSYDKNYNKAVTYAKKKLGRKEKNIVLKYLDDFNNFIESKNQLLENCKRGKASFLSGKKIGSRYNAIKLDKKTKDRNNATRIVNQLMEELKNGTIKINLDCNDIPLYYNSKKDTSMIVDSGKSKITVLRTPQMQKDKISIYNANGILNVCLDEPTCKKNYEIRFEKFSQSADPNNYPDNVTSYQNATVLIHRFLNENIVYTGISPHIVLYLENALCTGLKKIEEPIMLTATEPCIGNLEDMYKNSEIDAGHIPVILFQVIYTLASIHNLFPYSFEKFRHNSMSADIIYIQRTDPSKQFYYYVIDDDVYAIPNIGFSARIGYFKKSDIPYTIDNSLSSSDRSIRDTERDISSLIRSFNYFYDFSSDPVFSEMRKEKLGEDNKDYVRSHYPEIVNLCEKRNWVWLSKQNMTPNHFLKKHFSKFRVKSVPKKTDDISIFGIEKEIKKKQK